MWAALLAAAALLPYPFLPRHLTIIDTLAIGVPSFFLALAPNTRRYRPGFASRVLRFAIPAGAIIAAATFAVYCAARAAGLPPVQQGTAATLVTLILSLCVLVLLATPLTWRCIVLVGAVPAAFALLFPVPAVRVFCAGTAAPRAGNHPDDRRARGQRARSLLAAVTPLASRDDRPVTTIAATKCKTGRCQAGLQAAAGQPQPPRYGGRRFSWSSGRTSPMGR